MTYEEKFRLYTDEELYEVITDYREYVPEVVLTAITEIESRFGPSEHLAELRASLIAGPQEERGEVADAKISLGAIRLRVILGIIAAVFTMLQPLIAMMKLATGEIIVGSSILAYLNFLQIPVKLGLALAMYRMKVWAGYWLLGFFLFEILVEMYRYYDYYGAFSGIDFTAILTGYILWVPFTLLAIHGLREYRKHLIRDPDADPVLGYE